MVNFVDTLRLIGRPNAYYPNLAKPFGGSTAAILFSQLFYWQDKTTSEFGVYKTRDELEEETGLTHHEQRTAIKKLVEKGVLIVTEKRIEHKTYYKIDNEKVNDLLADFANSIKRSPRTTDCGVREIHNVDVGVSMIRSSLDQETTTEITTKTTTNNISDKLHNAKKSKLNLSKFSQPPSEKVWTDYLEHRKNKKAKLTQTALNRLIEEINKANTMGYSTDSILAECMLSNWQGFKSDWLLKSKNSYSANQKLTSAWEDKTWMDEMGDVL